MKTIEKVLTGVATLSVGTPDSRAQWSNEILRVAHTHAVKLYKAGSGAYGSTGIKFKATGNAAAQKITDFELQTETWGFYYYRQAVEGAYWMQMEFLFEDPNSEAWVEITTQTMVAPAAGTPAWILEDFDATDFCFFGGWSPTDGSFSDWSPAAISDVSAAIQTAATGITNADDWLLTRVKVELWESTPERWAYIDDIIVDAITYTLTPGSTTVEDLELSGPWTEIGYTEDGVTIEYTADETDIEVEEETFPIDRVITKETCAITCNMAEASLFNMDKAMAGSVLSGNILKLGAGVNKPISLQIIGTNELGENLAITIPRCTAVGSVAMPFKKGEKTVVPVTFQALKTTNEPAVTVVYNAV